MAFLLLNLWNLVKASAYVLLPFKKWRFTLARWRLWLWEAIKQRLGFVLELPVIVHV